MGLKTFGIYSLRWQIGTPLYAVAMAYFVSQGYDYWTSAVFTNFIGACIFFKVDKLIFKAKQ